MSLLNHGAGPEKVAQFNTIAKKAAFQIANDLADGDTIKPLEALEVTFLLLINTTAATADILDLQLDRLQEAILGSLMIQWNRDPMQFAIDIREHFEDVKTLMRGRLNIKNRS